MRGLIREYAEIGEKIREKGEHAAILFADMKGSTEYKLLKSVEDAQVKIYRHNETLTQGIKENGGLVVKYLGDGVMAMFQGEVAEINAINAAIKIQGAFQRFNEKYKLRDHDKIESKIGINSGVVYLWNYEGYDKPDPQGTTVDIAARFTELAKPGQILCSGQCKDKCSGEDGIKFGEIVDREIRGVTKKVAISEVIWSKELKVAETKHESPPSTRIEALLKSARRAEEQGDYNGAVEYYMEILKEDQQHFLANLNLSHLIFKYPKEIKDRSCKLEDALEFAKEAKESNSFSGHAKLAYATLLWEINKDNITDEILEEIIEETKMSGNIFDEELNENRKLMAFNNLAYYYGEKYKKTKKINYLNDAIKFCEYIEKKFNDIRSYVYPGFLDTYAFLLILRRKNRDVEKAENLLKEAEKLTKTTRTLKYVHKHLEAVYGED